MKKITSLFSLTLFVWLLTITCQAQVVGAGSQTSYALNCDGTVNAWGYGGNGELGNGTTTNTGTTTAVQVKGAGGVGLLSGITAISAGDVFGLALKNDSTIWAWGKNDYGEIGNSTVASKTTLPVQVMGVSGVGFLKQIVAIEAGRFHSLALKSDSTVLAWGYNNFGQLGDSTIGINRYTPVKVKHLTKIIGISAGLGVSVAIKNDGTVWAWGENQYGQLGDGTTTTRLTPVQVKGAGGVGFLTNVVAVEAGEFQILALKSDGTLWAWGYNNYGQLGDGTTTNRSTPVQVLGAGGVGFLTGISKLAMGIANSPLVLKNDGTLWAWGWNLYGQLGSNTTTNSSVPVQVMGAGGVGFLTGITAIGGGVNNGIALKNDGTIWNWGYNNVGQLGNGTTTTIYTPVQILGSTPAATITASGATTFCAGGSVTLTSNAAASYLWSTGASTQSITVSTAGSYSVLAGCAGASANSVTVTVNALPSISISNTSTAAVCSGTTVTLTASGSASSYTWSTTEITTSITVTPTLTTNYAVTNTDANGCTNTATTSIAVNLPSTATLTPVGCNSVTVNATTYTTSGTYTQHFTNAVGCDSALTINATVNLPSTATLTPVGCNSVTVNATTYTTSGTYTQHFTNAAGCDSALTINATINLPSTSTLSAMGCSSVTVNATTYTTSGIYTQHFTNAVGCDSALTINATVNLPSTATLSAMGCNSVTINAITYTMSGTYTQHLTNHAGCDSAITINVTLVTPVVSVTSNTVNLCQGDTATLTAHGATSYTWSTTATTATITVTPTVNTTYTVTGVNGGCVNMVTYTQTVSTTCVLGISKFANNLAVSIYPNPALEQFTIEAKSNAHIIITNTIGQTIINETMQSDTQNYSLQLFANGVYFVKVIYQNQQQTFKLIKQQ
jgi:alpha-tubulin suppressor-like RCC1 family protein